MPYQLRVSPPGRSEFLTLAESENFIPAQPETAGARKFQFELFTSCRFLNGLAEPLQAKSDK